MVLSRSSSNASTSSTSSTSSSSSENFHIFVKLLSGDTIPLTIPSDTTLPTLLQLLSLRTSAPTTSIRLVHAGKHLTAPLSPTPTSTAISSLVPPSATLHMALPLLGGMPPKKIKCTFNACKEGAQRIVGDCSFCQGHFCGKHRMLEDHQCKGLEDCKKESHERNKEVLETQRTVALKGI